MTANREKTFNINKSPFNSKTYALYLFNVFVLRRIVYACVKQSYRLHFKMLTNDLLGQKDKILIRSECIQNSFGVLLFIVSEYEVHSTDLRLNIKIKYKIDFNSSKSENIQTAIQISYNMKKIDTVDLSKNTNYLLTEDISFSGIT